MFQPAKITPLETKKTNLLNHKIIPTTHEIAPGGRFLPQWRPLL